MQEKPEQHDFTEVGKIIGTPQYMSPEQKSHPSEVDHRADIYALGVVFYQMLTGELPDMQIEPPSKKVSIDVRLDEVVLRALEHNPEKRYQQASVLKTQLEIIENQAPEPKKQTASHQTFSPMIQGWEYRSKTTLFGLPLVHIATGLNPQTGKMLIAKGIIAIGNVAVGVIALGGFALGGISFGGVALGALAYGGIATGLMAIGGLALALLGAAGGLAIAPYAMGGLAVGLWSWGGLALGAHPTGAAKLQAMKGTPEGAALAKSMLTWTRNFGIINVILLTLSLAATLIPLQWVRRRARTNEELGGQSQPPKSNRSRSSKIGESSVIFAALVAVIATVYALIATQPKQADGSAQMPAPREVVGLSFMAKLPETQFELIGISEFLRSHQSGRANQSQSKRQRHE